MSPRPAPPPVHIPLSATPWGFGVAGALLGALAGVLAGVALRSGGATLAVLGLHLSAGTARAMLGGAGMLFAVLSANAGLKHLTLGRIAPPAVTFGPDALIFPTTRFLRGLWLVHLPWSEIRDVTVRSAGLLEAVDIETTAGVTLTVPAELYPRTWRAPRIAEAIQQEAARR